MTQVTIGTFTNITLQVLYSYHIHLLNTEYLWHKSN